MRWGLAIGGGGRNGAFACGALYRLTSDYGLRFEAVSGTSTGALMAGPALLDEVETLNDVYRGGVRTADVLDGRTKVEGFFRGALHGTGPLRRIVERYSHLERLKAAAADGRFAIATYVNMRTGELVRHWTGPPQITAPVAGETWRYGVDGWIDAVMASASMPILMDEVMIGGDACADGGLVDTIPVAALLRLGLDAVVVLRNSPERVDHLDENPSGILTKLERTLDIILAEVARTDVPSACEAAGTRLYVIAPTRSLGDSLDFDPEKMIGIWREGFEAAGRFEAVGKTSIT